MSDTFDPYHRWLGIPPKHQPPDHYRLLGIERFEDDPEVIRDAADRQMVHVRSYGLGEYSELSQKILNELAAAKVCLSNPRSKAAYDQKLRDSLPEKPPDEGDTHGDGIGPELRGLFDATSGPAPARAPILPAQKRPPNKAILAGLAAAGLLLLLGLVVWAVRSGGPASSETASRDRTPKQQGESKPHLKPESPVSQPPPSAVAPFGESKAKEYQQRWAEYLRIAVVKTNSIGMKLALIPPGEFQMGSTEEEVARLLEEAKRGNAPEWYIARLSGEAPKHRVKITKPFYLGLCELTQPEYERVMGDNPSPRGGDPSRPVERVTWDEAQEFCRKLGELPKEKAKGSLHRLPTEAEWEYACRAGATSRYCFGDDASLLDSHAWWKSNSTGGPQPVGRLRPNAWGLFDMHGNVWEWCADWHAVDYYGKSPTDDPTGPESGSSRVKRGGGSRNNHPGDFRCACRNCVGPDARAGDRGFRVARTITP